MRKLVKVTRYQIKQGERGDCRLCPVANAVQRATGASDVCVIYGNIYFGSSDDDRREQRMPRSVQRFVRAFDAGKPVKPFAFTLNVPD